MNTVIHQKIQQNFHELAELSAVNLYITKFSAFQKIHPIFQIISKNSADCYAHKENIHQNFTALEKSTEKSAEFFTDLCDH